MKCLQWILKRNLSLALLAPVDDGQNMIGAINIV
jgi:hypothetical protein